MKIRLDIDMISEDLWDALFEGFREEMRRQGLDPDKFSQDQWEVTCEVEHKV